MKGALLDWMITADEPDQIAPRWSDVQGLSQYSTKLSESGGLTCTMARMLRTRQRRRYVGRSHGTALVPVTGAIVLGAILLAQQAARDMFRVLGAVGLFVVAVVVLLVVIVVARKMLLGHEPRFEFDDGFTLADLRQLLSDDKISEAEFDRAKVIILARSTKDVPGDGPHIDSDKDTASD